MLATGQINILIKPESSFLISSAGPEGQAGLCGVCALPTATWLALCSPWTLMPSALYPEVELGIPLGQVLPGFYYPSFKLLKWSANDLTFWHGIKSFQNQSLLPDLHGPPLDPEAWLLNRTLSLTPSPTLLLGTCFLNTVFIAELKCYREITTGQDQQPRWDYMSRYNHGLHFTMWRVGFNKGYYFKHREQITMSSGLWLVSQETNLIKCQW